MTDKKILQAKINIEYIIKCFQSYDTISDQFILNHINKCIEQLENLENQITDTKLTFSNSELMDIYSLLRFHPLTQGFIKILALLETET